MFLLLKETRSASPTYKYMILCGKTTKREKKKKENGILCVKDGEFVNRESLTGLHSHIKIVFACRVSVK